MATNGNFPLTTLDGYNATLTTGQTFISNWVDVGSAPWFDISVIFTGGTPAGTLKLQKSNDVPASNKQSAPLLTQNNGQPSDLTDALTGHGQNTIAVAATGVFTLDQNNVGYKWVRVVFTASGSMTSNICIKMNTKTAQ